MKIIEVWFESKVLGVENFKYCDIVYLLFDYVFVFVRKGGSVIELLGVWFGFGVFGFNFDVGKLFWGIEYCRWFSNGLGFLLIFIISDWFRNIVLIRFIVYLLLFGWMLFFFFSFNFVYLFFDVIG